MKYILPAILAFALALGLTGCHKSDAMPKGMNTHSNGHEYLLSQQYIFMCYDGLGYYANADEPGVGYREGQEVAEDPDHNNKQEED